MLYYVMTAVYVIICSLLLVVVLLQQGKGGGIAAGFGGSSSQTAFGARAGATALTRATQILGILFMVGALTLTIMGRVDGGGSVVGGIDAPLQEAAPELPTTLPTTPLPAGGGSGSDDPQAEPPTAEPPTGSGSGS